MIGRDGLLNLSLWKTEGKKV